MTDPLREIRPPDGRFRRWVQVPEMNNRYLRVILLSDGETFTMPFSTVDLPHESALLRRHRYVAY